MGSNPTPSAILPYRARSQVADLALLFLRPELLTAGRIVDQYLISCLIGWRGVQIEYGGEASIDFQHLLFQLMIIMLMSFPARVPRGFLCSLGIVFGLGNCRVLRPFIQSELPLKQPFIKQFPNSIIPYPAEQLISEWFIGHVGKARIQRALVHDSVDPFCSCFGLATGELVPCRVIDGNLYSPE